MALSRDAVISLLRQEARRQGVDENLVLRVARQESGYNPAARSPVGAIGVMQLMPDTAKSLGVDPYDPQQNIAGGVTYLRQQLDRFGRADLALAAYNAGPGAVQKYGGVPPYKETQQYVQRILGTPGPRPTPPGGTPWGQVLFAPGPAPPDAPAPEEAPADWLRRFAFAGAGGEEEAAGAPNWLEVLFGA